MKEYDFNKLLSPPDFELLSRDLMQRELNITFESFKEGRDQGIDFKFSTFISTNSIVLQCKNYKNDYTYFLRELKKELEKVKKLNPQRYMITTSVNLSPANKEEIKEYFKPYILKTSDIYGGNDLNNLLSKPENSDIEKQHSKLWLASTTILERVLHSNIYCQSEMLLEEIEAKTPFFVYSQSYDKALNILNQERCCIISGNPGVGKTTLAYMLLLNFIKDEENFEIHEIKSFDEANKVWNRDKKQVFYFDDFLGQNFRTIKLDKNEDANISRLMKRISRYENKYIIFTTREYILNQAKQDYEKLSGEDFEFSKMIIDVNRYNNKIKAEILYNHLHFSSLPNEYSYELLDEYAFLDIINHKNYNPRIIEHLTDIRLLKKSDIESYEYSEYFLENLDNPIKIWSDIFENDKISFEAKIFIYVLFIGSMNFGDYEGAFLGGLKQDFNQLYEFYIKLGICQKKESIFDSILKELDNSLIRIAQGYGGVEIKFYDPSINDFILQYLDENTDILINIIKGLKLFATDYTLTFQLYNIIDFENKIENKINFNYKLQKLFINEVTSDIKFGMDYLDFVLKIITTNNMLDKRLDRKIRKVLEEFDLYENSEKLILTSFPNENKEDIVFFHQIGAIYNYYRLSSKYNVQKYTNQELYEFVLNQIEDDFWILCLYHFTFFSKLTNVKRDKRKEVKNLNSFINNFLLMIDEIDELEKFNYWNNTYANDFNIDIESNRIHLKEDQNLNLIFDPFEEKEEDDNVDIEEIISLFDGLR